MDPTLLEAIDVAVRVYEPIGSGNQNQLVQDEGTVVENTVSRGDIESIRGIEEIHEEGKTQVYGEANYDSKSSLEGLH
ncbi:hypothetical protein Syun_019977 [Stephania yunnanensis]|uniref:Uncharacterized protein n=1 Tax=Stephania yunnanensis TaxID=152371 RepID=A0AAP0IVU1_9MAGN